MSTVPETDGGVSTVRFVELKNSTVEAVLVPKVTVAPLSNPVPTMLTVSPPLVSPMIGRQADQRRRNRRQ